MICGWKKIQWPRTCFFVKIALFEILGIPLSIIIDISGERIWVELRQILAGPQVASLVEVMLSLGMGSYIGASTEFTVTYIR